MNFLKLKTSEALILHIEICLKDSIEFVGMLKHISIEYLFCAGQCSQYKPKIQLGSKFLKQPT